MTEKLIYFVLVFISKGRCLSDPNLCLDGVTMIFWAKIDQSVVAKNPQLPKYVFSSGGADRRSRGFALFHENGMFVLRVVAAEKKWRLTIQSGHIPFNSWFSFTFTWKEGRCFFLTGFLFVCFLCLLFTNTLRKSSERPGYIKNAQG